MNNFDKCFEYSLGSRERFDISLLRQVIPNCKTVEKTQSDTDRQGVDYIAYLKDGSKVTIDAKTRQPGAKRWWQHGEPELALEQYSVKETKKVGWLFKRSTIHPDYILYTFDKADTPKYYLIPFMLLRKAAFIKWQEWARKYLIKPQPNETHGGYTSTAIFVPASVLIAAVAEQMAGEYNGH